MVTYLKTEGHVPGDNNIHFMPCSIKYNGKANVSTYLIECKGEIEGSKNLETINVSKSVFFSKLPVHKTGHKLNSNKTGRDLETRTFPNPNYFSKISHL